MDPGSAPAGAVAPPGLPGTTPEDVVVSYHPSRTDLVALDLVASTCAPSFSRRVSRPSYPTEPPPSNQRVQGRPDAGRTRGPRAAKKHAAEPQVRAETTGLPCANGLRLIRALPGDRRSCPHRPCARRAPRTWPQHREARTTRLHRPYRVVRPLANARCNPTRPSHPLPNARDDREAPLFIEPGRAEMWS